MLFSSPSALPLPPPTASAKTRARLHHTHTHTRQNLVLRRTTFTSLALHTGHDNSGAHYICRPLSRLPKAPYLRHSTRCVWVRLLDGYVISVGLRSALLLLPARHRALCAAREYAAEVMPRERLVVGRTHPCTAPRTSVPRTRRRVQSCGGVGEAAHDVALEKLASVHRAAHPPAPHHALRSVAGARAPMTVAVATGSKAESAAGVPSAPWAVA